MFQVTNGDWYNIGDDRMKGDILGEQIEVVSDLALTEKSSFREISQYLWGKYSGLGVDKERKISSRDKRDNRIQGVMDTGQSLAEES